MSRNNLRDRRRGTIKGRPRRRLRPILAELEGRTLLSTTFTVSNTRDDGSNGTLRWAIDRANSTAGPDTINFDPTMFSMPRTIKLTQGQLTLTDPDTTTITGPSPGAYLLSINGGGKSRIFNIDGGSANLSHMTITGGSAASGGGLYNHDGDLKIAYTIISGDTAGGYGGGLDNNGGTVSLTNSAVNNNHGGTGGGISNRGFTTGSNSVVYPASASLQNVSVSGNTGGGLYDQGGSLVLANSFVENNRTSGSGGGLAITSGFNPNGYVSYLNGSVSLTNVTISGNIAQYNGGGLYIEGISGRYSFGQSQAILDRVSITGNLATSGGGLYNQGGTVDLFASTVSSNHAHSGGGLDNFTYPFTRIRNVSQMTLTDSTVSGNVAHDFGGGLLNYDGTLTLTNATISGNSATVAGGGLYNGGYFDVARLTLANTTISRNSAGYVGGGLFNRYSTSSDNYNTVTMANTIIAGQFSPDDIEGDTAHITGSHNLIGGNPMLAPLGNYGGPTRTMPPLPGSPALDAGSNALADGLSTDQRGFTRIVNGTVDIGAVEDQVVVTAPADQSATPGQATTLKLGSFADLAPNPGKSTIVVNFGDGTPNLILSNIAPGAIPDVTHTFANPGTRTITVIVTDPNHDANQATFLVKVQT